MGLQNSASQSRSADLNLLSGIQLPSSAKAHFIDPMTEKARELISDYQNNDTLRITSPSANRLLRTYPETAIFFVNPNSIDDPNAASIYSKSSQSSVASRVNKLIDAGIITQETKMEDMIKLLPSGTLRTFIPEIASEISSVLSDQAKAERAKIENYERQQRQEYTNAVHALDEARARSYANGTGSQAPSQATLQRMAQREIDAVMSDSVVLPRATGRSFQSSSTLESPSPRTFSSPLSHSELGNSEPDPNNPRVKALREAVERVKVLAATPASEYVVPEKPKAVNVPLDAISSVTKSLDLPAKFFWANPENGGPRIWVDISKIKQGESATDLDGRMRVTILGKNEYGKFDYQVEFRRPGSYDLFYKSRADSDFYVGKENVKDNEVQRELKTDAFPAVTKQSFLFKHPVSNFDFIPLGGGYKGVSVKGMREGDTRIDDTGTIRITHLGVNNEGWKFRVEFADPIQYSMRTRIGDRGFAFQKVGGRPQEPQGVLSQNPELAAREIYKAYSEIYSSNKNSTDPQSHTQAMQQIKSRFDTIDPSLKEIIKTWASMSNDSSHKMFFERFANSL